MLALILHSFQVYLTYLWASLSKTYVNVQTCSVALTSVTVFDYFIKNDLF